MLASLARLVTVGFILVAALLFSISTALERQDKTAGPLPQSSASGAVWGRASATAGPVDPVWGIDVESTGLVVGAVVVSVAAAVVLATIAAPWVAALIALVMLAFAGLDILTVIHDVGRPGGTPGDILAVVVMMLHVLACFVAAYLWSETGRLPVRQDGVRDGPT